MNAKAKISTSSLAETVFKQIQIAIVKGEIPHGSKISEPELAKKYGISRGPLREAIRRLQGRKLVVYTPNAGVRVVSLSPQKLLEIYDVREALEGMASKLAAIHMTQEEIQALRQSVVCYQQQTSLNQEEIYYQNEADLDFHYQVIQGCKNSKLMDMLSVHLYQIVKMYRYQFKAYRNNLKVNLDEHLRIVDAIEQRDPEVAEILMRRHISDLRKNIAAQFDQDSLTR